MSIPVLDINNFPIPITLRDHARCSPYLGSIVPENCPASVGLGVRGGGVWRQVALRMFMTNPTANSGEVGFQEEI